MSLFILETDHDFPPKLTDFKNLNVHSLRHVLHLAISELISRNANGKSIDAEWI